MNKCGFGRALIKVLSSLFLYLPLSYTSSSGLLLSSSRSFPVLQCDVTIRELMYRILRVLHSSFPTHTQHKWKAKADTHVRSLDGVTNTNTDPLIHLVHLCPAVCEVRGLSSHCIWILFICSIKSKSFEMPYHIMFTFQLWLQWNV